ncbi:MAG: group I intron-associated PD-(D/E)XK endonuclease [Anaerolineae bacterium]|nr:group I intron-associated PD-(D/E)XK endonuclease [Anaerolineae bacterium]MDQ7037257.1 group I intron-associated PD-(D/E)XK endonuclease [Anaerolineae bacterium]
MVTKELNPTQIGDISEAKLKAHFIERGYVVLEPANNGLRYDFVIEQNGRFQRIQAKTARLVDDEYILFSTSSKDSSTNGDVDYRGDIDLFAVYCPDNDIYYLMGVDAAPTSKCFLRVVPTKNNQRKGIRWAEDYEF